LLEIAAKMTRRQAVNDLFTMKMIVALLGDMLFVAASPGRR
jgi:hypothetical protein